MEPTLFEVARNILSQLKARLGPDAYAKLPPEQRELIRACCADAAELQVRALAAPRTPDAHLSLLRERAQINAQLCNVTAMAAGDVIDAFWEAVRYCINGAVAIAFAAV